MRFARCQLVIIIEPSHGLGTLSECLGDPPGVREHRGQPAGGHTRVTQESEVPMRVTDVLGQDPEIQQSHVGVGPRRKPRDKHREQVALNCRASAGSLRQSRNMREGTRRITVANRREAVTRTIRMQGDLVLAQRSRCGDDRPIEDILVEGPHPCANLVDRSAHRLRVGEARAVHRPPENTQLPLLVRDQVGAAHTRQLGSVLDGAQEAIARCELISITASDIAAVPQRLDRLQRRAHA